MTEILTHKARAERRKQIAEYASEHGRNAAATHFGVTVHLVAHAMQQHNISAGTGRPPNTSTFRILKMLLDGVPGATIARDTGLTRQRIDQIKRAAKEAGFTFSGSGVSTCQGCGQLEYLCLCSHDDDEGC